MTETITLAHVSDVHLSPLAGLAWRHLNVKRGLGYVNWRRQRKRTHSRAALDMIVADMKAHKPDHIAVTGDLINLGLPAEYDAATVWLHDLGTPQDVSVVPGNHDIYTTLRDDPGVARWADYMRADAFGVSLSAQRTQVFPFVRRVGPIALIGINSAVETPPFVAAGEVGSKQLAALDKLLWQLEAEGMIRVVLIHHPPLPGQAPPRRALRDAGALSHILAARGAELVLHGHNHCDSHMDFQRLPETGGGSVPVIGVASGSAIRLHKHEPLGRYNLLRIGRNEGRVHIECVTRGIEAGGSAVVQIERKLLT
ncbi:MAG: metallophosphoesterase family protein [Hyphomicrobium sp.]|jgi:3',5'-cyclic AMP phosphodiesterase CpdA